jgi:hypothetical protein
MISLQLCNPVSIDVKSDDLALPAKGNRDR